MIASLYERSSAKLRAAAAPHVSLHARFRAPPQRSSARLPRLTSASLRRLESRCTLIPAPLSLVDCDAGRAYDVIVPIGEGTTATIPLDLMDRLP